jgi:hypothetical protein
VVHEVLSYGRNYEYWKSARQELIFIEIMKKFLDIVTLVLALAGTALLVYSMVLNLRKCMSLDQAKTDEVENTQFILEP